MRPSTIGREEEVPDEHEACERRHYSEVQAKPNEVTKKKKAWQPSQRGTQEHRRQKRSLIMPYHTGLHRSWCHHCVRGRGRSRQHKSAKSSERTIPVSSADHCFIGGEMSVHESPVLVMVFRTRMQQGKELDPEIFLGDADERHRGVGPHTGLSCSKATQRIQSGRCRGSMQLDDQRGSWKQAQCTMR